MTKTRKPASIPWELAFWSTIAVLLAAWSTCIVRQYPGSTAVVKGDSASDTQYSWEGDDYPAYYPMEVRDAIMFPEDTVHYPIDGEDAERQWETQFPTLGKGWALEDGANRTQAAQSEHVKHCLNYLRLMALCRADVTLEPVINAHGAVNPTQPHLCKDWVQVYEEASRNVKQCKKPRTS